MLQLRHAFARKSTDDLERYVTLKTHSFIELTLLGLLLLGANGYVVVMPNVRGSGGRGFEFAIANFGDWGHHDTQDVLAATDYAVKLEYVDPERLTV